MSADTDFPKKLKEKGATIGNEIVYASGKLALYSTSLDVTKGLEILTDASVKKIAVAKPEAAPYGARAVELMKKLGLFDPLSSKLVYGENISQAAQYVFTGNAEVGFIALSLAITPEMEGKGKYYVIDPSVCAPIEQACIRIKTAVMNTESARFMNFVISAKVKPIWEKYGYAVTQ
jgi:molybdate transport system substrate-binding protein